LESAAAEIFGSASFSQICYLQKITARVKRAFFGKDGRMFLDDTPDRRHLLPWSCGLGCGPVGAVNNFSSDAACVIAK
jgi:hypothetical protein